VCRSPPPPRCHDIRTIFCGITSTISNGTIFLLKCSNLVLELIYHLPWVLRCKMGGWLHTCPIYDLLSVHWHIGIFLWVGFLLILCQAVSYVCRYLQMGRFADCITLLSIGYHETTERNGMDLLPPHLPWEPASIELSSFYFMSSHCSVVFAIVGILF